MTFRYSISEMCIPSITRCSLQRFVKRSWGQGILYPPWRCIPNVTILKSVRLLWNPPTAHSTESRNCLLCKLGLVILNPSCVPRPGWCLGGEPRAGHNSSLDSGLPLASLPPPRPHCPLCHPMWQLASCGYWALEVQLIWIETSTQFWKPSMRKILWNTTRFLR